MPSIRIAVAADGAAIAEIYRPNVRGSVVSFELEPPDAGEMTRRVAAISVQLPWLVLEERGAVAGYVYASPYRARAAYQWSAEVSAYVHPAARRRGIARALYVSLFDILRLQGYRNAYAGITLPNPASVGLHEALRFMPVGVYHRVGYKLGRWHDVGWWERPLGDHVIDPPPPHAIAEVALTAGFDAALEAGLAVLPAGRPPDANR